MSEVIDVEVEVKDALTIKDAFNKGMSLPKEDMVALVDNEARYIIAGYETKGLVMNPVVTADNRQDMKDLRSETNKYLAGIKSDLKLVKEDVLEKYNDFEKEVLTRIYDKIDERRVNLDEAVKLVEMDIAKEKENEAREYWTELNKLQDTGLDYVDVAIKIGISTAKTTIQKELKEKYDVAIAELSRVNAEKMALAAMPNSERLLELYGDGKEITMAEVISKVMQEEAEKEAIIKAEAERIAKEAADRQAVLEEEQRQIAEFVAHQQLNKEPVQASPQPVTNDPTFGIPEPLKAAVEPVTAPTFDMFAKPAAEQYEVKEINVNIIGTDEQFVKMMDYAKSIGVEMSAVKKKAPAKPTLLF